MIVVILGVAISPKFLTFYTNFANYKIKVAVHHINLKDFIQLLVLVMEAEKGNFSTLTSEVKLRSEAGMTKLTQSQVQSCDKPRPLRFKGQT